jgi:hypothetical protein
MLVDAKTSRTFHLPLIANFNQRSTLNMKMIESEEIEETS